MRSLPLAVAFLAGIGAGFAQSPSPPASRAAAPGAAESQSALRPLSPEERGDLFMARKMYRDAIDAYTQGSKDSPVLWNKTGIAWHQLGQLDRARAYYEHAMKLNPRYSEAQNNIGTVYYAQKSFRRAISAYRKAIAINPDSASFHKNLGTAYFARKQDTLAMAEYRQAIGLDPNVFENRSLFGVVLEESNVEDRARYHYSLAKLYASGSRADLALQYLRKALEEGFRDKKKIEEAPEFQAMRDMPEFKELLAAEPRVL
jgi:tetratricopeptide (TPR) repeat protein